jgi:hypothetical protein
LHTAELFDQLNLQMSDSLLWQFYKWQETLMHGSTNTQLKCVTTDLLLYGPTSLNQIEAQCVGPKRVRLDYTLHECQVRMALQMSNSFSAHRIIYDDEKSQKMTAANQNRPMIHTRFWTLMSTLIQTLLIEMTIGYWQ